MGCDWLLTGNNQISERKSAPEYTKTPLMIFDKIGVVDDLMYRTSTADSFFDRAKLKANSLLGFGRGYGTIGADRGLKLQLSGSHFFNDIK